MNAEAFHGGGIGDQDHLAPAVEIGDILANLAGPGGNFHQGFPPVGRQCHVSRDRLLKEANQILFREDPAHRATGIKNQAGLEPVKGTQPGLLGTQVRG